ncbi:MAG: hypothetical protein PHW60_13845 [Kiritimatiellae bacterium]|nr:hypothetical protein [Kiritimatiellia bacterium]
MKGIKTSKVIAAIRAALLDMVALVITAQTVSTAVSSSRNQRCRSPDIRLRRDRDALQYRERIGIRARGGLPAIVRQLPDDGGNSRETVLDAALNG